MGIKLSEIVISQFLAYLLAKFVIKPLLIQFKPGWKDVWVISPVLAGMFSYILYGQWDYLALPIWSGVLQFLLDLIFRKIRKNESIFLIFELLIRIAGMAGLSLVFTVGISTYLHLFGVEYFGVLTLISGWLLVGCWSGEWIGLMLKRLEPKGVEGIKNGGKYIGLLERSMVYLLMLLNAPTGIGFLMTAKTIFRFGEINQQGENRKQVEYILIGTLLSFFMGALVSVLVMYFSMQFFPGWVFKLIN